MIPRRQSDMSPACNSQLQWLIEVMGVVNAAWCNTARSPFALCLFLAIMLTAAHADATVLDKGIDGWRPTDAGLRKQVDESGFVGCNVQRISKFG